MPKIKSESRVRVEATPARPPDPSQKIFGKNPTPLAIATK